MNITTKVFGEITIDDDKIIHFPSGIIGFPDLTEFALVHDEEKGAGSIHWLQSMQEPAFAMPVMDPLYVKESYNPMVEDELLKPLGDLQPEDTFIMVTVSVPKDIHEMSVNLQAPIVINADNKAACQIIVDNESGEYPVKFKVYDILQAKKEKAGE